MGTPYLQSVDSQANGGTMAAGGSKWDFAQTHGLGAAAEHIGKLFAAGTAAGLVECVGSYPLDTVKTRMQTQTAMRPNPFTLTAAIAREEGARALYRGMSSRVVASMLACSVVFGVNGALKELLQADSRKPQSTRFILAAMGTGLLESVVYCPLELVKTRMQILKGPQADVSTLSFALRIYRNSGLKGCYRGFSSLALKESIGNVAYFSSYTQTRQAFASDTSGASMLKVASAGGLAGICYALVVHPIDTVKSVVQTDSMKNPQYRGFYHAAVESLATRGGGFKGVLGLYQGLSPALARAFVGNALIFLTLETALDALGR